LVFEKYLLGDVKGKAKAKGKSALTLCDSCLKAGKRVKLKVNVIFISYVEIMQTNLSPFAFIL